jgi:hypothetical protein
VVIIESETGDLFSILRLFFVGYRNRRVLPTNEALKLEKIELGRKAYSLLFPSYYRGEPFSVVRSLRATSDHRPFPSAMKISFKINFIICSAITVYKFAPAKPFCLCIVSSVVYFLNNSHETTHLFVV